MINQFCCLGENLGTYTSFMSKLNPEKFEVKQLKHITSNVYSPRIDRWSYRPAEKLQKL